MAERIPSSDGAYGRVAYVPGWRACPSGLCSRAARMADWVHKLDEWWAETILKYSITKHHKEFKGKKKKYF